MAVNEQDLIIEENNLVIIVAHHWDTILKLRHMTAVVRFGHAHHRDDEEAKRESHEYLKHMEAIMKADGVEPLDLD